MKFDRPIVEIYASIHAINSAAALMAEHIEKLGHDGLIEEDETQYRLAIVEESRAVISSIAALSLNDPELDNAKIAEDKKLAIEQKWKENASDTGSTEQNK